MKILQITTLALLATYVLACTPKSPTRTVEKDPFEGDLVEKEVAVEEKGPPPPLPTWVKFPTKPEQEVEIKAAVQTLSLLMPNGTRVKLRPPYQIFQAGNLQDVEGQVMMPVRVVRDKYWLLGKLDMYQVEVFIPGGTLLHDGPNGTEVGFVSSPIIAQVKEIQGDWASVTHELNAKCSPLFLKVWVRKNALMSTNRSTVPFPAKYTKGIPNTPLRNDAALFDVFPTATKNENILQLPMCNVENQVLMVGRTQRGRTQFFFKPAPDGAFAIQGWIDKQFADGGLISTCTCGIPPAPPRTPASIELEYTYETRLTLPLYMSADKDEMPVGVLEATPVKRVIKNFRDQTFGQVEIEDGMTFFIPFHDNYYLP